MFETDANGTQIRPYSQFLEPQIAHFIGVLKQQYPNANNYQLIDTAYNIAVEEAQKAGFLNSSNNNGHLSEVVEHAEKAERASSSIRGSSAAREPAPKPNSIREAVEMAHSMLND